MRSFKKISDSQKAIDISCLKVTTRLYMVEACFMDSCLFGTDSKSKRNKKIFIQTDLKGSSA